MTDSEIEFYKRLIKNVIEGNDELIDTSQIHLGVQKYVEDHPVLESFDIEDDNSIVLNSKDRIDALTGLKIVLLTMFDYVALFASEEEAKRAITGCAASFIETNKEKIAGSDIFQYFPEFLAMEFKEEDMKESIEDDREGLLDMDEGLQAIGIFERLFGELFSDNAVKGDKGRLKAYIKALCEAFDELEDILLLEDGRVEIHVKFDVVDEIVPILSTCFDEAVDEFFGESEDGRAASRELTWKILEPVKELAASLGITQRIIHGIFASQVSTGIDALDRMLGGGIQRGNIMILQGPPGFEKGLVTDQFIRRGLEQGYSCVAQLSMESPKEFLRNLGSDYAEMAEDGGGLTIVDWYSYKSERVVNVETEGSIIKSSRDLTNVGIALDMARARLPPEGVTLAALDIISPLITHDFDTVYNFLKELRAKFKKIGITGILTLEKGIFKAEHTYAIQELFDGVLDIERAVESGYEITRMGVVSASGSRHQARYLPFDVEWKDGISEAQFRSEDDRILCEAPAPPATGSKNAGTGVCELFKSILDFEKPHCLVTQGDSGREREIMEYHFIKEALNDGGSVVVLLSTRSPGDFFKEIASVGVDVERYRSQGNLIVVDWYSWKRERIINIESEDGIIKSSHDLTNLAMALDTGFGMVPEKTKAYAVMDIVSPALQTLDFESVFNFSQVLRGRLHKKGFFSLFLVEKEMHGKDVLSAIHYVFDGVLDITSATQEGGISANFRPTRSINARKMNFRLSIDENGVGFQEKENFTGIQRGVGKQLEKILKIEERISARKARMKDDKGADEIKEMENDLKAIKEALADQSAKMETMNISLNKRMAELARKEERMERQGTAFEKEQAKRGRQYESFKLEVERIGKEKERLAAQKRMEGDMRLVLKTLDELLGKMPEKELDAFSKSSAFKTYEKLLEHFNI